MRLSGSQLRRLERGDYTPLIFDDEPYPCCVVLSWQREERHWDDTAGLIVVPKRPLRWLEVVSVKRHKRGGWQVRFNVTDLRHRDEYLASGGGYTSSPLRAVDDLPVVPQAFLDRIARDASERDHKVRLELVAERNRERWRRRRRRRLQRAA